MVLIVVRSEPVDISSSRYCGTNRGNCSQPRGKYNQPSQADNHSNNTVVGSVDSLGHKNIEPSVMHSYKHVGDAMSPTVSPKYEGST